MKPISATPHAVMDYCLGFLLVVSPWLFGFNDVSSAATLTMVTIGAVVIGVSLLTNYPLGLIKVIPFPVHGVIESVGALGLLASPWLMGFSDLEIARNLAVILGIGYFGIIALTNYHAYELPRRPVH